MGVVEVLLIHFLQFLVRITDLGALYRLNIWSLQKLFVCKRQHPLPVIFLVLKFSNLLCIHGVTKVFQNFKFTRAFEIGFFTIRDLHIIFCTNCTSEYKLILFSEKNHVLEKNTVIINACSNYRSLRYKLESSSSLTLILKCTLFFCTTFGVTFEYVILENFRTFLYVSIKIRRRYHI